MTLYRRLRIDPATQEAYRRICEERSRKLADSLIERILLLKKLQSAAEASREGDKKDDQPRQAPPPNRRTADQ